MQQIERRMWGRQCGEDALMLGRTRLYSGMPVQRWVDGERQTHRILTSLLFGMMIGGGCSSCSGRADAVAIGILVAPGYALVAPWALAGLAIDHLQEEDIRRQLKLGRGNPEHIPVAVARSVSAMGDITADTVDQLLDTIGLTAYRKDVLIVYLGTTQQDVWIYYRPDAALNARFDPITRRIVGPITNFSGKRPLETGGNTGL